jgi:hypothetical protein
MIKTTYVSNTIRIPTHEVDFSHQGHGFGENLKSTMEPPVNRGEVRRKERRKKEKRRRYFILPESRDRSVVVSHS